MNRINPLYILFLFITFAIISFSMVKDVKSEFNNNVKKSLSFNKMAIEYASLKNNWFDKREIQRKINNLRNEIKVKNGKLEISISKKIAIIKLHTNEKEVIAKFVNKILNKKLLINKLDITRNQVFVEVNLK